MMQGFAQSPSNDDPVGAISAGDRIGVEVEIEARRSTFRGVVMRVYPDCLWVALPAADARIGTVPSGQPLDVTLYKDGRAVQARSAFLHAEKRSPERIFLVEPPKGGGGRLTTQRLALDAEHKILILSVNDVIVPATDRDTVAAQIGTHGIVVHTALALGIGDRLTVAVHLGPTESVTLDGQVTRIDDPAGSSPVAEKYVVSIRFLEPPLEAEERIARYILAMQDAARGA